jgi:hypothetical protein
LKDAALLGNPDQNHHAGQKPNGVEIDPLNSLFPSEDPCPDDYSGPKKGHDSLVKSVRDNDGIGSILKLMWPATVGRIPR